MCRAGPLTQPVRGLSLLRLWEAVALVIFFNYLRSVLGPTQWMQNCNGRGGGGYG